MALTTGGSITPGSAGPQTQTPSAPTGGSGVAGSISQGAAPTPAADVVMPADQVDSMAGIETTGTITQQSANDSPGSTVEPPTVHPNTPYTGEGVDKKEPPTSGGPSQAVPKTGRG